MRRASARIAVLLLVTQITAACSHWSAPRGITPQAYIATSHPARIRVTDVDDTQTILDLPWVAGDTLGGLRVIRSGQSPQPRGLVRMPLRAVRRFEVRKTDVGATVATAVVGAIVVGGVIGFAVWAATFDCCM